MPDVALFEPLCKELEISIPELLSGRKIDAEDQQQTAEQLLMESISMRKPIGLSVFLQLNSVIGVLLVISPFLFHPERPLNLLLVALGFVECAMVVYFDSTLPGRENAAAIAHRALRLHDLLVSDLRGDQLPRVRARESPAHHGDPGVPDSLRPCAFDSVLHLAIPKKQISENAKRSLLPDSKGNRLSSFYSSVTTILNLMTPSFVSFLHSGQQSGKFSRTVSS